MAGQIVVEGAVLPRSVIDALEYFSEPVEKARARAGENVETIVREVGVGVREISDQSARIHTAIKVALKLLDNSTDDDEARALLELVEASSLKLCNLTFDFAGSALVALELPTRNAREVTHG